MWFRPLSVVFCQADPLGRSLLITKSVTTSTDSAEMLKGKLKFKLNVEKKNPMFMPNSIKKTYRCFLSPRLHMSVHSYTTLWKRQVKHVLYSEHFALFEWGQVLSDTTECGCI